MNNYKIAVGIGSLHKDSFNRKLANAWAKMAPTEVILLNLEFADMPLYNQDDDGNPAALTNV